MSALGNGRPPSANTQIERGQMDLFAFDTDPATTHYNKVTHGEYVRALKRTVDARVAAGTLEAVDSATIALAVAGMRALEGHEARGETYGPSKILGPLADVLKELAPTDDGGSTSSEFDRLLVALGTNDEESRRDVDRNAAT